MASSARKMLPDARRHCVEGRAIRRLDIADAFLAEAGLGEEGISYIQTPNRAAFDAMPARVRQHLAGGGSHSTLPCANQLWMLFGFTLFGTLSRAGWSCL